MNKIANKITLVHAEPVGDDDAALGDKVFAFRMAGNSEQRTARHFAIGRKQIRAFVAARAPRLDHEGRVRTAQMELARIEALEAKLYNASMATRDMRVLCHLAIAFSKLSQVKGNWLSLDAVPIAMEPLDEPPPPSSTEKIRSLLAHFTPAAAAEEIDGDG